jgi:hypothetical protein
LCGYNGGTLAGTEREEVGKSDKDYKKSEKDGNAGGNVENKGSQ